METLSFNIQIKASKKKVWNALWEDQNYRNWTSVFSEGSHAETDWKEGGRILFLNGKGQGMYSLIEKNHPYEFMSFRHLGDIVDGKEQAPYKVQSIENYTLSESVGYTNLRVDMEVEEGYKDYFNQQFLLALEKVKALAEK